MIPITTPVPGISESLGLDKYRSSLPTNGHLRWDHQHLVEYTAGVMQHFAADLGEI